MKSVDETLHSVLSRVPIVEPERVPLAEALHRVLRENALADLDSPSFACSAMDGYALRSAESGSVLTVALEIQAGDPRESTLPPGACARIFTGAKLPGGADCVLMQEHAALDGNRLHSKFLAPFENVRRQGENCARGSVVVRAGRRLQPSDIAALASCGVVRPLVSRRPRVVHFATGNELVDPAATPSGSQIRDTNSTLIAALLAENGAVLAHQSRVADRFETFADAVRQTRDFDLLFISGGASVGDYDFTQAVLRDAGFEIRQAGVNLRPGKPLLFAVRGRQYAFGIPGNPVSHFVIFHLLIAPLLAAMTGVLRPEPQRFQGRVRCALKPNPRETWWPCRVEWIDGGFVLQPLRFQSSGDLSGMVGAGGLIRVPANSEINEHDIVEFLWLQSTP